MNTLEKSPEEILIKAKTGMRQAATSGSKSAPPVIGGEMAQKLAIDLPHHRRIDRGRPGIERRLRLVL